MKTKCLSAAACAVVLLACNESRADEDAPAMPHPSRLSGEAGRKAPPLSGLRVSALQTSGGLAVSAGLGGRGAGGLAQPFSLEEWRALFPLKSKRD